MLCSIRGCDRSRTNNNDTHGDLCPVHRDAEHALGREPAPISELERAEINAQDARATLERVRSGAAFGKYA